LFAAVLVVNEFPRFQKQGLGIKFALYVICLLSYFSYVIPILTGNIGWIPLLIAVTVTALLIGVMIWIYIRLGLERSRNIRQVIIPAIAVIAIFLLLYWGRLIPPIPLSIQYIGIYHGVDRSPDGKYMLYHERPW